MGFLATISFTACLLFRAGDWSLAAMANSSVLRVRLSPRSGERFWHTSGVVHCRHLGSVDRVASCLTTNFKGIWLDMAGSWVVEWLFKRPNLQNGASSIVFAEDDGEYDCSLYLSWWCQISIDFGTVGSWDVVRGDYRTEEDPFASIILSLSHLRTLFLLRLSVLSLLRVLSALCIPVLVSSKK